MKKRWKKFKKVVDKKSLRHYYMQAVSKRRALRTASVPCKLNNDNMKFSTLDK